MITCREDLYNKYIPMEDGELRDKFIEACKKFGINPRNSFDIHYSRDYYEVYRTDTLEANSTLLTLDDFKANNSESSPQSTQTASTTENEQLYSDMFMTLLQATQKLSDGITVTTEGKFSVWSEYHDHELVFDTLDNLLEYVNVVEKMKSFEKNFK